MANARISELPAAGALAGGELVPVVQAGETRRTTVGALPFQASDPTLTALAGMTWTSGRLVVEMTAADTFTLRPVGAAAATDVLDRAAGDARYAAVSHTQAWSTITATPTTLAGYGITDGVASTRQVATGTGLTGGGTLAADRTISIAAGGVGTTELANDAVTFAKLQNVTSARLLGRATAGSGDVEEITLGTNLSLSGTTLNATGGGASTFTSLTDTPSSYTGAAGQALRVNGTETGLEFFTAGGSGTVTEVNGSGGTTGLMLTGGPINTIGTLTLGGTLAVANGGTGSTTAAAARTALGVPATTRNIATGTGLTGGGDLSADRTLALTGQALALHNLATNGLVARTGAGAVAARSIAAGANISVTNGDGVSGNPTVAVTGVQQGVEFRDEGVALGTSGTATAVDFVGAGVTASRAGDVVTVTISGGGGGGGSPGGSSGQVQWNSAGSFAGASGLTINGTGEPVVARFADFTEIATPAAPGATAARLFAREDAGLASLYMLKATGRPQRVQANLGGRRFGWILPSSGTGISSAGGTVTAAGTVSTPAIATTSKLTYQRRSQFSPTAAANVAAGFRIGDAQFIRGTATGRGGIELWMRFATVSTNTECSAFFGLTSSNASNLGGADPGADRVDAFGLGRRNTDTNWHFIRRTGSGTAVYDDTGIVFNTTGGDIWDLHIYAAPGATEIGVRWEYFPNDWSAPSVDGRIYDTTLPTNTALLGIQGHVRAGATSFSPTVASMHIIWSSDF